MDLPVTTLSLGVLAMLPELVSVDSSKSDSFYCETASHTIGPNIVASPTHLPRKRVVGALFTNNVRSNGRD